MMPSSSWDTLSYDELLEKKRTFRSRLDAIEVSDPIQRSSKQATTFNSFPFNPKVDTHWDFVMKEMMWLGDDFQGERKRQLSLAKKCASSVKQYHKTKETRRLKELQNAASKQRRMGAKIGRDVKSWWSKIERVISYKQKLKADEQRERAMNTQLILLVQQTERYSASLSGALDMETSNSYDSPNDVVETNKTKAQRERLTIEASLAMERKRKSKERVRDYARMKLDDREFYGESTVSDAASDVSYQPESDTDDESTIKAAMDDELLSRVRTQDSEEHAVYQTDLLELRTLHEEAAMEINQLMMRFRPEGKSDFASEEKRRNSFSGQGKHVRFRRQQEIRTEETDRGKLTCGKLNALVPACNAVNDTGLGIEGEVDQDFSDQDPEVDDETTIAEEERLAQKMAAHQEITLLEDESKMSITDLLKLYYGTANDPSVKAPVIAGVDTHSDLEAAENEQRACVPVEENLLEQKSGELLTEQRKIDNFLQTGRSKNEASISGDYAGLVSTTHPTPRRGSVGFLNVTEVQNDEYQPTNDREVDDERTIAAEEKLGQDLSYEDELSLLKRENEMSIEALRAMYTNHPSGNEANDEDDQSNVVIHSACKYSAPTESDHNPPSGTSVFNQKESNKSDIVRKRDSTLGDGEKALHALETSATRARTTMASRPYLLARWVQLRKYQQVGLNWLVSLQSRSLNGILADEMGLGKTLQTISLLSYLASYKGIWGPHLVVVPTSVIINWETELKRFCPALRVLCYYGSAKRRKELRAGWTQTNWYHVVITSYQLAVQDAFALKRKKWYYLILDEAQNIKNFQSQRWQTLINFNTQRRLLLTGTPLQNSLMELWSLLHFLMPYIFHSRKEFSYWFSNPMNSIIEGKTNLNDGIIKKLHGIIRPFILRRLKKEVETQMPGKFEHIVKCQLSRRQMQLYEEFLSRSSTRQALQRGGNFMGMMNVLMQLRKVCNHPDLFEPRSIMTPFVVQGVRVPVPGSICFIQPGSNTSLSISEFILKPLWSRNSSFPTVKAGLQSSDQVAFQRHSVRANLDKQSLILSHNCSESQDELQALIHEVTAIRKRKESTKMQFQDTVNSRRCTPCPFPYPQSLQDAVDVEVDIFHRVGASELRKREILSTPASLLRIRKLEQQRANQFDGSLEKIVVCVPRVGASAAIIETTSSVPYQFSSQYQKDAKDFLEGPLGAAMQPYSKVLARLSAFFPDRKLVQYDSGKLQKLAELLRGLQLGGHRALIFTQMSKMLDILETFLNIHGYTYLRLDGSTGIDQRQRYMDRFNNDEKIFCFILSTRSGGMGINLTGADSVIFYDSDWNPAMDAQAQDRAHRIGQTREVHIYRLVTEHTIEENILMKANQKKRLDIMVMDQGKFDASLLSRENGSQVKHAYTKGGLHDIIGVNKSHDFPGDDDMELAQGTVNISNEEMEMAMASLEDDDDVQALLGAHREAAEVLKEFDDSAEVKEEEDNEEEADCDIKDPSIVQPAKRRKLGHFASEKGSDEQMSSHQEIEKDFATWQSTVGLDAAAIDRALAPVERYALNLREEIDPFFSPFHNREESLEVVQLQDDPDIDQIERMKSYEEEQAISNGDLLGTCPQPESLIRQRNLYQRERMRLLSEKKRRQLTGESWSTKVDGITETSFWYNYDTGEALWNKPNVLLQIEEYNMAMLRGWCSLPLKALVNIMDYLVPFKDRQKCASVCLHWKAAANDIRFVRHVYPVEMGAISCDTKRLHNHYRTLDEVMMVALPGDTIELSDGHYWVTEPGLVVDKPLKFVGDEKNPSNVVVEIAGSLGWKAKGGRMEGITFRRSAISTHSKVPHPILNVTGIGRVDISNCVFDNGMYAGSVTILSGSGSKGSWRAVHIRNGGSHGVEMEGNINLDMKKSFVSGNCGNGIKCSHQSMLSLYETKVANNLGFALQCQSGSRADITNCCFDKNRKGIIFKEVGCVVACSGKYSMGFESS
ncbi:unnamed protein product [Cylindrotheca closterium]|uniref:Uncharacterized protein n=1 Tax=Cylindrotheca closterium TaxID=2856 RepID=A0AAD2FZF5_9STRA|nr:unnamed protein product [Cylindrotheca closterium]